MLVELGSSFIFEMVGRRLFVAFGQRELLVIRESWRTWEVSTRDRVWVLGS